MIKHYQKLLLSAIFIFSLTSIFSAETSDDKRSLGLYAEMYMQSESVWLGWDINSDKPAYMPCVVADLWQSGFSLAFWASLPFDHSTLKVNDDLEFFLKYQNNILEGSRFEINAHAFADYIRCPNNTLDYKPVNGISQKGVKQLWKINGGISFNKLFSVGDSYIVPSVNAYYITPAGDATFTSGTVWEADLSYSKQLTDKLSMKVQGVVGYHHWIFDVNDLGHVVGNYSMKYNLTSKLSAMGFVSYQESLSDGVNSEDEFWGGLGLGYSF